MSRRFFPDSPALTSRRTSRRPPRGAVIAAVVALGATGLSVVWATTASPGPIVAALEDFEPSTSAPERAREPVAQDTNRTMPQPGASAATLPALDGGPCIMQPALSEVELAELLQEGYEAFFGHAPTANRLACGWAHCAFEHARGKKLFGNNIGHITTTGAWRGRTCHKSFTHRVSTNPDRWASTTQTFRMHPTLLAGVIDYWKLMHNQYPGVLMACDQGNALSAAQELRRRHYFTGPEQRYVQSLAQLYLEALGTVIPKTERPAWPIGPKHP